MALLAYAVMPVLLGMCARALHPGLPDRELALPTLLVHDLPPLVGSLALAALFSAEVSAADAALFMLTTSLSQDLYRALPDPVGERRTRAGGRPMDHGGERRARRSRIALVSPSVTDTLAIFYTLLAVSLFVPVMAGLWARRVGPPEALAAMAAGVAAVRRHRAREQRPAVAGLTPAMWGLLASGAATLVVRAQRFARRVPRP